MRLYRCEMCGKRQPPNFISIIRRPPKPDDETEDEVIVGQFCYRFPDSRCAVAWNRKFNAK